MKIGLLGGSFNPAHQGHLHISKLAMQKLALDQVWWIPTVQNPFKDEAAPFAKRLEGCLEITKDHSEIVVKNYEQCSISTYELVKKIKEECPECRFCWIMGADNLEKFHLWKNFLPLINLIEFAIFSREDFLLKAKETEAFRIYNKAVRDREDRGLTASQKDAVFALDEAVFYDGETKSNLPKFTFFETPNYDISSSAIREKNMVNSSVSLVAAKASVPSNSIDSPDSSAIIVDSHCHLDLLEKQGHNIDEIIQNAALVQVNILQTICTRVTEIDKILSYTRKYKNVFASLGLHPNNVDEEPKINASQLLEICAREKKIIGLGETGLDYYYKDVSPQNQKASFVEHIRASQESGLPVIIHSRDADNDMMEILASEQKNKKFPALLHCFSSSQDLARKALDLEVLISISGIVTFKNALDLQQIVKFLPLNSLLVETDSPYLAPVPYRGKTNQPAYTRNVVEFVAQLKDLEWQEVAAQTTQNFLRLFNVNEK